MKIWEGRGRNDILTYSTAELVADAAVAIARILVVATGTIAIFYLKIECIFRRDSWLEIAAAWNRRMGENKNNII